MVALVLAACDAKKADTGRAASGSATATKAPEAPPAANAALAVVTALRLYDDYKSNTVGADEKYRGKALRVTGIADHVARDGAGAFLDFRVHGRERVQAHFVDENGIGDIKAGGEATVRCFGDGEFGGPQLKSCVVEK